MQFLHELGNAHRYYKEQGIFPFITFKRLPNISNARWNSKEDNYEKLGNSLKKHNKAHTILKKNWNRVNTAIQTQRSSICVERAIKIIQEILCKSAEKNNLKFILSNK